MANIDITTYLGFGRVRLPTPAWGSEFT